MKRETAFCSHGRGGVVGSEKEEMKGREWWGKKKKKLKKMQKRDT